MWGEILTHSEVDFCVEVKQTLQNVPWAERLLRKLPPTEELDYSSKPILFELRFAGEIARLGLTATYEFPTGVGSSTVDFRIVHEDQDWLIELVSIMTSDAVKAASGQLGMAFWSSLSTDASDQRQSLEGEILLVQQKIGQKVFANDSPTKFPEPSPNRYHIIIADMRGFGLTGGDVWDYREIAYGAAGLSDLHPMPGHFWKNKNGSTFPILGLFDPANTKQRASALVQQRIHVIGFCSDEEYSPGSLLRHTFYLTNPHLLSTEQLIKEASSQYPLKISERELSA